MKTKPVPAVVLLDIFAVYVHVGKKKKCCLGKNVHFPPRQLVIEQEIPVRTGTKLTIRDWKWS